MPHQTRTAFDSDTLDYNAKIEKVMEANITRLHQLIL